MPAERRGVGGRPRAAEEVAGEGAEAEGGASKAAQPPTAATGGLVPEPLSQVHAKRFSPRFLVGLKCRLPPHSGQLASPSGGAPSKAEKPSGGKKKVGWLKNIKSVAISFIQDKDSSGNSKSTPSTTTSSAADATSSSSSSASSSERLKAHQSGKSCKELTGLYMCQEIMAHEGSIWSIKFSTNGRWLASAGKDHVVCIWLVVEASSQACLPNDSNSGPLPLHPPAATPADGTSSSSTPTLSKKSVKAKSGRDTLPEPLLRAVGLPEPRHGGPHMVLSHRRDEREDRDKRGEREDMWGPRGPHHF
uniref:Uncharacterized protein n=1 Tax=Oryza sativa subsp. japonica TaxID=39947 RepID=Q8H3Y8_ORYSJ|nr:hypothetical protein [Oryza sativa Japonica Group]